jgi:hypothetical protein
MSEVEKPSDFDYINYAMNPFVALNPYKPAKTNDNYTFKPNF